MSEVPASERIILAIDTSEQQEAERLTQLAKEAGARSIKLGLELSSKTSWEYCSQLAEAHELEWVADAKIDDIPNTTRGIVRNITNLDHPPLAITIHTSSGEESMRVAQAEAGDIKMLGVTVLTSIEDDESERIYHTETSQKVRELARDAARAGLKGIVASPREVGDIKRDPKTRHLFAMIPGTRSMGAEKGDQARTTTPAEAIRDGADLLVIGREITQAKDPAKAFDKLIKAIEGVSPEISGEVMAHKDLIIELAKIGGIKFGEFKLKSGMLSPIYIDLRVLVSYPKTMKKVARAYAELLEELDFDRMAAVPYAAMPIVAAVSAVNNKPWIYTRKEVKDYGTKKMIEGEYESGERVVVVDDMVTDGASKLEVIAPFKKEGLKVEDIAVLLDREQGATKNLATKGYKLHSVSTMTEILKTLFEAEIIDQGMLNKVEKFLADNRGK